MGISISSAGVSSPYRPNIPTLEGRQTVVNVGGTPTAITNVTFDGYTELKNETVLAWLNDCMPNLYDEGATFSKPFDTWLAERQAQGAVAEPDWAGLAFDLQSAALTARHNPGAAIDLLDNLAARYTAMQNRFLLAVGEIRQEWMEKLAEMFENGVDYLINAIADSMEKQMGKFGMKEDTEDIRRSLRGVYNDSLSIYTQYLIINGDFMNVMDTEDEWQLSLDRVAALALQNAVYNNSVDGVPKHQFEIESDAPYTVVELKALTSFLGEMEEFSYTYFGVNEAELGFRLGDLMAKMSLAGKALGAGEQFQKLTNRLMNHYVNFMVQESNRYIESIREFKYNTALRHEGEADMDKDAVLKVFNAMQRALDEGKAVEEIWRTGYEAGREILLENLEKEEYANTQRYSSTGANSIFAHFYEPQAARPLVAPTDYTGPISARDRMVYSWQQFFKKLDATAPLGASAARLETNA